MVFRWNLGWIIARDRSFRKCCIGMHLTRDRRPVGLRRCRSRHKQRSHCPSERFGTLLLPVPSRRPHDSGAITYQSREQFREYSENPAFSLCESWRWFLYVFFTRPLIKPLMIIPSGTSLPPLYRVNMKILATLAPQRMKVFGAEFRGSLECDSDSPSRS